MIKAILFDAGDVYLKGDFPGFVEKSCEVLGFSSDFVSSHKKKILNPLLLMGKMDPVAAFEEFFEKRLTQREKEKILGFYDKSYKPDYRMRELALKLKRLYLIGIITNSESRFEHIAEANKWYDIFDTVVYSHKIGIIKPDKRIYLHAANLLNISPEECLFIDDIKANAEGAEKAGMHSIHFVNYFELFNELKKFGITV